MNAEVVEEFVEVHGDLLDIGWSASWPSIGSLPIAGIEFQLLPDKRAPASPPVDVHPPLRERLVVK